MWWLFSERFKQIHSGPNQVLGRLFREVDTNALPAILQSPRALGFHKLHPHSLSGNSAEDAIQAALNCILRLPG